VRTPRLIFALLILACGFLAGLVLSGRTRDTTTEAAVPPAQAAAPRPAPVQGLLPAAQGLPDFSSVAARTVPAVANISSTQVVARQNSPLSNDPFFRYFFGDDSDLYGPQRDVERSLGSGVIVSPDGYILTNNHVVAGEQGRISLRQLPAITVSLGDKRELRAQIVGVDPTIDLALLKIDATNLPTMPWGDSSQLKVAQWVLAIGNPFQLNQTVTLGIVSALGRTSLGISGYEDFIQTDAAINPGNSGGALINSRGELVGINTGIYSESGGYQGIGFAVPSRLAQRIVGDLMKYGEVQRGSIGYIGIEKLSPQLAEEFGVDNTHGALVSRMSRASDAYDAGIRPGDVIVGFNGQEILDPSQFLRLVSDAKPGTIVTIKALRGGRTLEFKLTIVSSAAARSRR